jgi:hypothetical protein
VALRFRLDFMLADDGTCHLPGYEVRDSSGELVALGGYGHGGPRYPTVEAACRAAFEAAMVSALRNGLQLELSTEF